MAKPRKAKDHKDAASDIGKQARWLRKKHSLCSRFGVKMHLGLQPITRTDYKSSGRDEKLG